MKADDNNLKLSKEQRHKAGLLLKKYIEENFDVDEIGGLTAELMVDFISERLGKYYYNIGVADAIKYMSEKVDDLYLIMKDE